MKQFVKEFKKIQNLMNTKDMIDCGAGDTEPICHFENEICRWLDGKDYRELDANGWELYGDSEYAAVRLNEVMNILYKELTKLYVSELSKVKEFLRSNFWYKEV